MDLDDALATVWRQEWGRVLALLVAQFRRVDLAEDALAEAFAAAARTWPRDGMPIRPAAWLLTVARRTALDQIKAEGTVARKQPLLVVDALTQQRRWEEEAVDPGADIEDDRLRMVFLACHPALAPEAQAALALRLVLGLPTAEIARLFLVPEATMAARITRAKKKVAAAGIPFAIPEPDRLGERVEAAAHAVYLCFTAGYAPGIGPDLLRVDLAGEAIRLGRLLRALLPAERVVARTPPAADGGAAGVPALLALMLLQHARRDARVGEDGALVLLPEQDRDRWHHDEIDEGLALLKPLAPTSGYAEELRLQAVLAALHATAPTAADTRWAAMADTYAALETLTGSPVVRLNRAVAVAEAEGAEAGLALLVGLEQRLPLSHRLPAVQAELQVRRGDPLAARTSYDRAIALCRNETELTHLRLRLAALG